MRGTDSVRSLSVGDGTVLFRLTADMLVRKEEQLEPLPDSALAHKGEDEQQNETANDRGSLQYNSPDPCFPIRHRLQGQDTPLPVRVLGLTKYGILSQEQEMDRPIDQNKESVMDAHKKHDTTPAERPPIKRRDVLLGVSGAALAGFVASPALAAHHEQAEHVHDATPKHRTTRPGGPSLCGHRSDVPQALSQTCLRPVTRRCLPVPHAFKR